MNQVDAICQNNPHIHRGMIDNKYRVEGIIGGGGMACVYKVRTEDDPHPYALKLLQPQFVQNEVYWSLFEEEGKRLKELNHPNIVRFYGFALRDTFAYIVMDYIEGTSLSDLLNKLRQENGELPLPEVIRISVQTTRALRYLHEQGIIHRDIKPANILIQRRTGKVFLSDFGIATEQGSANFVKGGTSGYMPPEQQDNIGIPITYKADLYALGVVTYEMLVGSRPFRANSSLRGTEARQDLVRKHTEAPIPRVTEFKPHLPAELNSVIERAMAKHPDQRYPDARAFMVALHQACLPILTPDLHNIDEIQAIDPYGPPMEKIRSRRPWALIALVMVGILLAGGAIILGLSGGGENASQLIPTQTPTSTEETVPITLATEEATPAIQITEQATKQATEEAAPATQITEQASKQATEEAMPAIQVTEQATNKPTEEHTETPIPSATLTNTPTATTPPPTPTLFLENEVYLPFLQNEKALPLGPDLNSALAIAMTEFGPLIPLNAGEMNAFRVEIQLASVDQIQEYGVVYRWQDAANYWRFVVTPATNTWRVEEIRSEQSQIWEQGNLPAGEDLSRILVMGQNQFFRFEVGKSVLQSQNETYPQGQVGLWLQMADSTTRPQISSLTVASVGEKARQDDQNSPTPAQVVNFKFLLKDNLSELLSTGTSASLSINCQVYLQSYSRLDRHLSQSAELASLAQKAINAGALVESRCEGNLGSSNLSFASSPNDYFTWEMQFRALLDELDNLP